MCCVPQLKRRGRRTALASRWLPAVAILLLLWFYLSGSDLGTGPRVQVQTGWPVDESKHKPVLPGVVDDDKTGPEVTTTSSTTAVPEATEMPAPNKPDAGAVPAPPDPAVVLPQGTYMGATLLASERFPKAVEAFRGVPYAQDTGGPNRFRPPQPLPESTKVFDAVEWGQICPSNGEVRRNMSENCLNANIYRPAGLVDRNGYEKTAAEDRPKTKAHLPVIVYVHGGGFNTGHGTERNMATFIAWADAPMVAVNFNYRVGALGFLPSEVTAREGLLNLGLRDQQMLLEWVQANIETFGGDPKNVTVMGLSAGAHSIGHHIMYYSKTPDKAPFAKAILESGATTARAVFYPTHSRHLIQFREFLIAAGVDGVPEADIFSELRKLPLEVIAHASKVVWDKYVDSVTWPFQPVIDGPNTLAPSSLGETDPLIPNLPISSWLAADRHLPIPILTGYNTNEGTVFIPRKASTPAAFRAFFQNLIPSLTPRDLDQLETLYPDPSKPNSPYKSVPRGMGKQWARLDAAYAQYAYICPVLQTAHYMSQSPAVPGGHVYVYRYAATAAFGTANHGDEAPVVAHDMEEIGEMPGLVDVSREMHARWVRFVVSKDGDPNPSNYGEVGAPVRWSRFVSPFGVSGKGAAPAGSGRVMVFGEGNDEMGGGRSRGTPALSAELSELEKEACRFWWERVPLSEGLGKRESTEAKL